MRCERCWLGIFCFPETKEEEEWLKNTEYRKTVSGFGSGWWTK